MLLIADNLQLTLPSLARMVAQRDSAAFQEQVVRLTAAGAEAIDINTGPLGRDGAEQMIFCLQAASNATDRPLLIDTLNPAAIRAALSLGLSNRMIINGFSLEAAKLTRILPLAVEFDVEIIGYLLDAQSRVPTTLEDKLNVGLELFEQALAAGLRPEQLIIDPVVGGRILPAQGRHHRILLEVLTRLPEILGYAVKSVASLSNLTSGPTARARKEALEAAWIPMLVSRGLDMLLVNMDHRRSVDMARRCGWLLSDGVFSWEQVEDDGDGA